MLTLVILSGVITTMALLLTLARVLSYKLIFGYATYIDVGFSLLMLVAFAGTLGGSLTAIIAGLCLALFLSAGRWCFGYSKLRYTRRAGWIVIDYPSTLSKIIKDKFHAKL